MATGPYPPTDEYKPVRYLEEMLGNKDKNLCVVCESMYIQDSRRQRQQNDIGNAKGGRMLGQEFQFISNKLLAKIVGMMNWMSAFPTGQPC